jgi:hypothetical protein
MSTMPELTRLAPRCGYERWPDGTDTLAGQSERIGNETTKPVKIGSSSSGK